VSLFQNKLKIFICSVAIDGVLEWRSDLLDSLIHNTWLHSRVHCSTHAHTHTHTHTNTLVHRITSLLSLLVAASNGRRSPSPEFPNCPRPQLPASNSNSPQQLNSTNSVTGPAHNISTQTAQKTPLLCYSYIAIVAFVSVGVTMWSLLSFCLATTVLCRTIT
jgi:hypothetical protein